MATSSAPAKNATLPLPRTIALAISVVQSKPNGMSMGEYIGLLKEHIAKGRRADTLSSKYRHLDRSSHWRAQCDLATEKLRIAEDVNVDLQLEIDRLKEQLEGTKSAAANSKKRKKGESDSAPNSKKLKRDLDGPEMSYHEAGEIGAIMLRLTYEIHIMLRENGLIDADAVMHNLIRIASTIPQVVQKEVEACIRGSEIECERLQSMLTVVSRAVSTVLRGFDALSNVSDAAKGLGTVIYHIAMMYKKLLDLFEQLSLKEANKALTSAPKVKSKSRASKETNVKNIPALSLYANFLTDILDNVKCTEANKQLFEGMTFCALQYIGTRLYTSVFGQPRPATIVEEIELSNPTDEIIDDESADQKQELQKRQIRLEAPYLVHLLSRLMTLAPAHLGSFPGSSKLGKTKQGTKHALTVSAKECLQRTLVNCMFGEEEKEGEDDLFRECLKMPVPKGEVKMPKIKNEEVQDWFKREMWRLLGWEILEMERSQ